MANKRLRIGASIPRSRYVLTSIAAFGVLLAAWTIVNLLGLADPRFLPPVWDVAETLWQQAAAGELWSDMGASTYRIMVGYLIATVIAIPLGILIGALIYAEAALQPFIDFVRYMPVVAFVPLTILWVGINEDQKVLIIFLGTFFQQVLMVADAVRTVPRGFIDVGETLGLNNAKILWRIVLRSSAPRIWDALRITLGWAWTWLVVAELVAATSGLGFRITVAQRFLQTDLIFAYVIVLGVLGLIFDQVMRLLGRAMFRYERIRR